MAALPGINLMCASRLTTQAQAQPPSGMSKTKVTNKSHKINRNWKGQRLLPAAPLLDGIM
jgi:hypothetical protein